LPACERINAFASIIGSMNPTRVQFDQAADALRAVSRFDKPADAVLSGFFRQHRALGQQDRAFIAESVFGVLRRSRLLEHIARSTDPRLLLLAWLTRVAGSSARELEPALRRGELDAVAEIKACRTDNLPSAIETELPDWLIERLGHQYSPDEILQLGRALREPAPLDLRVNTLRAERDATLLALGRDSMTAQATPYSPYGLRLAGRPALNRHPLFLNGTLEVQDEGSQLVCSLLAPRRSERVVDFCAGAGGKTLMLGALMHSQGTLYAFDISASRLRKFQPRLARSGLSNVHPQVITGENDTRIKRLAGKVSRVLVDAPCSGFGTLRRNPDLKWRQSRQSVAELVVKQASILAAAATLVQPGGRLVYATCSLLAEENEAIVEQLLARRAEYRLLDCAAILAQQKIPLDTGQYLKLLPHVHGCDGFFAAVLERT
jgi:16S rRNA (cytosine967-C5)-methyltransferase